MRNAAGVVNRTSMLLVALLIATLALPRSLDAAPRARCTGASFSLEAVQTDEFQQQGNRLSIVWQANGQTTFECPNGERVIVIDVWEHAIVDTSGVDSGGNGGLRLRSRVVVGVSLPDGGTIVMGGLMQGEGSCTGGLCVLNTDSRLGSRPGNARLRMIARLTLDLDAGMVTDVEVQRILIDFTSAG